MWLYQVFVEHASHDWYHTGLVTAYLALTDVLAEGGCTDWVSNLSISIPLSYQM